MFFKGYEDGGHLEVTHVRVFTNTCLLGWEKVVSVDWVDDHRTRHTASWSVTYDRDGRSVALDVSPDCPALTYRVVVPSDWVDLAANLLFEAHRRRVDVGSAHARLTQGETDVCTYDATAGPAD